MRGITLVFCAAALAAPSAAYAQYSAPDVPHAGSVEVSGGVHVTRGYDFDPRLASEARNPTTGTEPLTLFQGDPRFDRGLGFAAHLGVFISRRLGVEGGVQVTRPSLSVRTSGDFEGAADTTIESRLTEYLVDGSVLYHFGGKSLVPYAIVGGGYLRQMLEHNSIVETGNEVHGGAGVKSWFGRRLGIRAEARVSSRSGGVNLDTSTKRRFVPAFTAGLAYLF